MLRHPSGPRLDLVARNLDGIAAPSADQMMMVLAGATLPVDCFAFGRSKNVDLAGGREGLKVPVYGCKADTLPLGLKLVMKLLGGPESFGRAKCLFDCRSLSGRPLGASRFLVHIPHHTTARARAKTLARTKATIAAITIVAPGGAST